MECAGVTITAPSPGALLNGLIVHSVSRAAFGVAMLTLLWGPFFFKAMRS